MNQNTVDRRAIARSVLALFIVYCLIHGYMLILTGTFHDDWLSYFRDVATKNMEGLESGRPYYSLVIEAVWNLPGYGYRTLSFITYGIAYICIYFIIYQIFGSEREALAITILTMAMPVNDARVLLANYPYALGMMLFYIATLILVKNVKRLSCVWVRIIIEVLYFLSFTLNSNLVMYGCVLLYLLFNTQPFKFKRLMQILDFILLPFVFFFMNKLLWPTYGAYANYNIVTWKRLIWSIVNIPVVCFNIILSVGTELLKVNIIVHWCAIALVIIVFLWNKKRDSNEIKANTDKRPSSAIILIFGLLMFIAGWFPYIVVRRDLELTLTGIQGRDSMQLGLGLALIFYALTPKKLRNSLVAYILILGIFHFNLWYLNYQGEWYRQLAFQKQIEQVDEIYEGGNYVVKCSEASPILDRRFYTWTGNTVAATGRENVFMLNGNKDIDTLNKQGMMTSILSHYPMFDEYEYNTDIKGTVNYDINITYMDTIKLKYLEMLNVDSFNKQINEMGTVTLAKAE